MAILAPTTKSIHPDNFPEALRFTSNRRTVILALLLTLIAALSFRTYHLGAESLGEDEFNKIQTVQEYRENGLSGKNGEHPFMMKGLQTLSISMFEKANEVLPKRAQTTPEAALRFPLALVGTFTALLIFLLVKELFGVSIGLVSAIFWAVEPMAIGFDRVAKEDSLVLFFFLLSQYFWVRGQTLAEHGYEKWDRYAWLAAAAFAALMASKYYPHLLAITGAYYIIFQALPSNRWIMGKVKWLIFIAVMGAAFLVFNPTILLPETWREMLKFSTENRIGHDSYEFMGKLYRNQMSAWLSGVPWTFYYVFIAVKTSLPVLLLFFIGLPLMFRKNMGDGRFLIFFWAFMWFLPFTFLGGKFTRYFTFVEPLILICAATGFCYIARLLGQWLSNARIATVAQASLLMIVASAVTTMSASAAPHYRLFTNQIGTAFRPVGAYFPHDEFYDAATQKVISAIAAISSAGSQVACETPSLYEYYLRRAGRTDIRFISLSDRAAVQGMQVGDLVVLAEGRRYRSNAAYVDFLNASAIPQSEIQIMETRAARIYKMDTESLAGIKAIAD